MTKTIFKDIGAFINAYKGQDLIFYCGCAYIIFSYLRPQLIYPLLNFLPWLQITILAGLGLMLANKQLCFTYTHGLVFLLAALVGASTMDSYYPNISMQKAEIPLIWAIEVLFLSNCVRSLQQIKLLFALLFLCLFKMSLFGAKVWITRGFGFTAWGIQGPPGYFQNSGEFSLLMAMTAVMSIPFIIGLNLKRRYLWMLPITAVMTVLGASSRGSQLAIVVGLLFLLFAYKKIRIKNIIYVGIICWLVALLLPQEQKDRLNAMGDDETSLSRLNYWKAGIAMAMENPYSGVGYDTFPEYYHNYYKEDGGGYLSTRKEVSHNTIIQVISTLGFPALFIYLLIHKRIYYVVKNKYLKKIAGIDFLSRNIVFSLKAGVLTYFVGSMFMSIAFYPYLYLLCGLSIALTRFITKQTDNSKQNLMP
jgi:putative inorganic carbon (HCO3(-)) transporter